MTGLTDKRREIVRAASRLFRRQGYAGTGLSEILSEAHAPKGSLYHYFPDGKAAIGEAAVMASGATMERELREFAATTPNAADIVMRAAHALGEWLEKSGYREGCAIATTILETAPDIERIRAAGERAYASWRTVVAEALVADEVDAARARRLATFAMSTLQGGLIQARVARSTAPLMESAEEAAAVLRDAVSHARAR